MSQVLYKLSASQGVTLNPQSMPVPGGDGSLTAGDFGVHGPTYQTDQQFIGAGIPSILAPFELSADQSAWQSQADEWARQKEAHDHWALATEVSDCQFDVYQTAFNYHSDCVPINFPERKTYTGSCRSDKGPLFQAQTLPCTNGVTGAHVDIGQETVDFHQVLSYESTADPYSFFPNRKFAGRVEFHDCGGPYVPENPELMPIPAPPNPVVPSYIPQAPSPAKGPTGLTGATGATGPTPVLYGNVTQTTNVLGSDIHFRLSTSQDAHYGPNIYYADGFIYCPCVDGVDGVDGTNGTNGKNGVDGAKGDKGDKGDAGKDADVEVVPYDVEYWWINPATSVPEKRTKSVTVPKIGQQDLAPLYNEVFFLLTQLLYLVRPAGPPLITVVHMEDLPDEGTIA